MKIAIIGSGISGLIAAYCLHNRHEIKVFEKEDWIGGHSHTLPINNNGTTIWIDTGFIVCNPKNYPNFFKLMQMLDIELQQTTMSFSVQAPDINLEYNGTNWQGIFAQKKNYFNPRFYYMLTEIVKFNKYAKQFLHSGDPKLSWKYFLSYIKLSKYCQRNYLYPMLSSIWSADLASIDSFPAVFLCQFLDNHGMLNINDRPQWYSVVGGSHTYVKKLIADFSSKISINQQVKQLISGKQQVEVVTETTREKFDKIIVATHSDQALALTTVNEDVEQVLSSFSYQDNVVTLHTDDKVMPANKRAWAAWNYINNNDDQLQVTYHMNCLQNLFCNQQYFVSLNMHDKIMPQNVIAEYHYEHPCYSTTSLQAQTQQISISHNNIYYCGAYWGYGFHEDGLNSGLQVVAAIDKECLCKMPFTLAK